MTRPIILRTVKEIHTEGGGDVSEAKTEEGEQVLTDLDHLC